MCSLSRLYRSAAGSAGEKPEITEVSAVTNGQRRGGRATSMLSSAILLGLQTSYLLLFVGCFPRFPILYFESCTPLKERKQVLDHLLVAIDACLW